MQFQDQTHAGSGKGPNPATAAADVAARSGSSRADGRDEAAPAGAPSSNRAPANYIQGTGHILRSGIDSLYLSFGGKLTENWDWQLNELKKFAQSDSEFLQARAQARIGPYLFQVLDHGKKKRCPYILDNSDVRLEIGRGGGVPMVHAQIKNQFLLESGADRALEAVRFVAGSLGRIDGREKVSRADLCIDFAPCQPLHQWSNDAWISRAKRRTPHYEGDRFTGWSIGKGDMSARLYDKLFELLTVSRKDYLLVLWRQHGWQESEPVWRLEFQFRRAVLKEMKVSNIDELLANLPGLWAYATQKWLLLKQPTDTDTNPTRWPLHLLWQLLQGASFGNQRQPALSRTRSASLPSDEWLFTNGMGAFSSYMAREGITDMMEAFPRFFADACDYHEKQGISAERYLEGKARLKGRKFGTIFNRETTIYDEMGHAQDAVLYQQSKDGK